MVYRVFVEIFSGAINPGAIIRCKNTNSGNQNPWITGKVVASTISEESTPGKLKYFIHRTTITRMFPNDGEMGSGDSFDCKFVFKVSNGVVILSGGSTHTIDFSQIFIQKWRDMGVLTTYGFENEKKRWIKRRAECEALLRKPPQIVVMGDHNPHMVASWNTITRTVEYNPVKS